MRIAHYYPRLLQERSGVTAAVATWGQVHVTCGNEVLFLSADPWSDPQGLPAMSKQQVVSHTGSGRGSLVPIGLHRYLRQTDLLVLHEGWVASNTAAAVTARVMSIPYVVMPHGVYEPSITRDLRRPRRLRNRLERSVLDHAMVNNSFESEHPLTRVFGKPSKLTSIPTPVSPTTGDWRGGGDYVAWFGRYAVEHKGLDLLLQALADMPSADRPRLELAGSDYQGGESEVRRLVSTLGLERSVELVPPKWGQERDEWLSKALGYVHPARWESHSTALLDVLALGVPCVVSEAAHVSATLAQARAALTCRPHPGPLAEQLRTIVMGGALVRDLSKSAKRVAHTHFSMAAACEQWVRHYGV